MGMQTASRPLALYSLVSVFLAALLVNWMKAEISFWPLLLHDAGFIWAEIPSVIFYRKALVESFDIGLNVLLLLLNYYVGKRCKMTRRSTAIFLVALSVSVLLGLLSGYEIKQLQLSQYPIFVPSILYAVPNELGSKVVWCALGITAGKYYKEIRKTS